MWESQRLSLTENHIWINGLNGSGKTTLLQAIALGLAPNLVTANGLLDRAGIMLGDRRKPGRIELVFKDGKRRHQINTVISFDMGTAQESLAIEPYPADFTQERIFSVGHDLINVNTYQPMGNIRKGALRSLFGGAGFYGFEDSKMFLKLNDERKFEWVKALIETVLGAVVRVSSRATTIGNRPLSALGFADRTIATWLVDVLVRLIGVPWGPTGPIGGIVLLDGIDLGLDPNKLAMLLKVLKRNLPRVQFIGTMVAPIPSGFTIIETHRRSGIISSLKPSESIAAPSYSPSRPQNTRRSRSSWHPDTASRSQ